MRAANQKRYQRNRPNNGGRAPGRQQNRNSSFESNGPNVRLRGTAQQLAEKYQQYARDAMANGDFVLKESYLQHAEHYFRIFGPSHDEAQAPSQPNASAEGDSQEPGSTQSKTAADKTRRRRWEVTNQNAMPPESDATKPKGEDAFKGNVPAFLDAKPSPDNESADPNPDQPPA